MWMLICFFGTKSKKIVCFRLNVTVWTVVTIVYRDKNKQEKSMRIKAQRTRLFWVRGRPKICNQSDQFGGDPTILYKYNYEIESLHRFKITHDYRQRYFFVCHFTGRIYYSLTNSNILHLILGPICHASMEE